ncbi:MAG: sugar ABC transporter permease [Spirochaetales bacterium]|nr:sugar ABC transporter permease [Spirochaetales bacterium]
MSVPVCLYIILFSYIPLWGWSMAFQDYKPAKGFFEQTWVGFKHFIFLFSDSNFLNALRNTLAMSLINLVLGFVTAIAFALLLNEIRITSFKRVVQTISYLPHFLSWVIAAGIVQMALSIEGGIVNTILIKLGFIKNPVMWLSKPEYFWGIIGISFIWKELGWNTIIYLAAMSGIDPGLYESAEIDGANRYQKMWHITLPGIKATIVVLLILSIGRLMEAGFEMQYLLRNGLIMDWSDTIDIFVINFGIGQGNYSLATAAGIFKSVVNITLLFSANYFAKKIGEERIV